MENKDLLPTREEIFKVFELEDEFEKKEKEEGKSSTERYSMDFAKSEFKINCKHPEIFHSVDSNGLAYCMKCGVDV